jgi:excisionase family DNA binding protein
MLPESATIGVSEAARLLGISRNLTYDLARTHRLPGAFRLGRRWLVSTASLDAFLKDPERWGSLPATGNGTVRAPTSSVLSVPAPRARAASPMKRRTQARRARAALAER